MQNPSFVLKKELEVAFEDRPVPEIKDPHDVKINVKKTGICGSDVHYYLHGRVGDFILKAPMVLGHESAGEVVEVGSAVTSLKVGDRVAMEPGVPSRYSDEYKSGHYNLCPHMAFAATPPYDGTLCKYYILPEDFCVKLPDQVSLEEGAMIEPLSVGVHSVKNMGITPGAKVAVFGAGPIGLVCTSVLKAFGATTIVTVDLVQSRLDLSREFGATHTFVPQKGDTPEQSAARIQELIGGVAPEFVLDASGAEPSINTGVALIRPGGTYMQVGNGKPIIEFAMSRVVNKELTVKGSFRYDYGDYKTAVELVASGKVNVKKLITHTVPFEKAEEAYQLVREGKAVKCIIDGPN
ncbi:sorbitol dehydrogenase 1 [Trichomonascus vanleenenianus]|uniref:L-iditol 2-dehydrogenase SOR1 n=1 Tax=Trichomonascus vanleenenianus TaxID=2268995 RepID=UPI003EC980FD